MSTKKEEYESALKMKFKRKRVFSEFILGSKEGDVDMRNKTTKKYKDIYNNYNKEHPEEVEARKNAHRNKI